MDTRIPSLIIKIVLESNPLKSIMLVRGLVVYICCEVIYLMIIHVYVYIYIYRERERHMHYAITQLWYIPI